MRQPLFFSAASLLETYRFFALMFSALVATVFFAVFLSSNRKTMYWKAQRREVRNKVFDHLDDKAGKRLYDFVRDL